MRAKFGWGRSFGKSWDQAERETSPFHRKREKEAHYGPPSHGMPVLHRSENREEPRRRFLAALKCISLALCAAPFAVGLFFLWTSYLPFAIATTAAIAFIVAYVVFRRWRLHRNLTRLATRSCL